MTPIDAPCPTVPRLSQNCFAVMCWDGPDAPALRTRDLDAHLAHVEQHWQRYVVAGPLREPGGEALVGSLFLVLGETAEQVLALMNKDPYFTNGQYARVDVRHFTQSIGLWVGGKIWQSADAVRGRAAGGPIDTTS